MEFILLSKVTFIVNTVVKAGYVFAGGVFLKTGITYLKDYKYYSSRQREE